MFRAGWVFPVSNCSHTAKAFQEGSGFDGGAPAQLRRPTPAVVPPSQSVPAPASSSWGRGSGSHHENTAPGCLQPSLGIMQHGPCPQTPGDCAGEEPGRSPRRRAKLAWRVATLLHGTTVAPRAPLLRALTTTGSRAMFRRSAQSGLQQVRPNARRSSTQRPRTGRRDVDKPRSRDRTRDRHIDKTICLLDSTLRGPESLVCPRRGALLLLPAPRP